MPRVKFENGQIVNFATTPTQADIDEVAQKLGITKQSIQQPQGFLQKTKDFLNPATGKALKFGVETFISPLAREVQRPFVSAVRGVQGLVPGGKTGQEPVRTPFGEVKPIASLTPGEAVGGAVEVGLTVTPVEKLLKPIAKFFGGTIKRLGGAVTGKGLEVIDEIIANPQIAKRGLRGDEVKVLKQAAEEAKSSVVELKKELSAGYKAMLEKLPTQEQIESGAISAYRGKELPQLTSQGLKTFVTKNLKEFNVMVDRKKSILDFTESPLRKSEEGTLKEVFKTIDKWKDLSPEGVDRLAIKVGNYVKPGDQSPVLNSILGNLKKDIRNYIGVRYPEIATGVKQYAQQADVIETLESILKVGKFNNTTEILKTSKAIQNLFKGDKQLERELLKELGMGDIVAAEAGRQLAQAPSRASATIGDTFKNLVQSFIPPKAVGELAALAGTTEQKIKPIVDIMQTLAPAERIGLFNAIARLFSENQESQ